MHGLYTLHRHVELGREPCVRCHDQEMYFVPPAVSTPVLAATVPTSMSIPVEVARVADAEQLVEVSASVSSLSLQLVSSAVEARFCTVSRLNTRNAQELLMSPPALLVHERRCIA